ncbi:MAG: hypothetical protein K0M50_06635 [Prolixibacteraceae bacterium]|jgi:hypothetical protein|nr:hypothetical protein [Prolixibacteraceae bacterium]
MENNTNLIEALLEKTVDYGKVSLELARLKALDKTTDVASSLVTQMVVVTVLLSFLFFLNFGLAVWLGKLLGEIYFGFFVVAGFYALTTIFIHLFLRKWIKRIAANTIIKQILK